MDKEIGKNGRGDSIIDVSQDDSLEDDFQQKKSPLSWLGKKWLDFLRKACIFCCKCTFQPYVCIYGKHDKLQQFITTCMMQVAYECNSFEGIFCCCTTSPGGCKRWVSCSLVTAIYLFHIQLLCTHMFRVYVLMFVLEGELKSHAHAFVFVYV
jgi:hypothetical protein